MASNAEGSAILQSFNIQEEGRRIWNEMHEKAFRARTDELKEEYDRYIIDLQQKFACLECREHFGNYINEEPPWKYRDYPLRDGTDIGYFYWSWKFHDKVNERLKKKRLSFEKCYDYYRRKICMRSEMDKYISVISVLEHYKKGDIRPKPFHHR